MGNVQKTLIQVTHNRRGATIKTNLTKEIAAL